MSQAVSRAAQVVAIRHAAVALVVAIATFIAAPAAQAADAGYISTTGATAEGSLISPLGVASDPSGNLYVANLDGRIVVLSASGSYVRTILTPYPTRPDSIA